MPTALWVTVSKQERLRKEIPIKLHPLQDQKRLAGQWHFIPAALHEPTTVNATEIHRVEKHILFKENTTIIE